MAKVIPWLDHCELEGLDDSNVRFLQNVCLQDSPRDEVYEVTEGDVIPTPPEWQDDLHPVIWSTPPPHSMGVNPPPLRSPAGYPPAAACWPTAMRTNRAVMGVKLSRSVHCYSPLVGRKVAEPLEKIAGLSPLVRLLHRPADEAYWLVQLDTGVLTPPEYVQGPAGHLSQLIPCLLHSATVRLTNGPLDEAIDIGSSDRDGLLTPPEYQTSSRRTVGKLRTPCCLNLHSLPLANAPLDEVVDALFDPETDVELPTPRAVPMSP
eukprot:gene6245-6067_t